VGSPFFIDDRVHIQANIGAASIQGGTHILIDEFKYALTTACSTRWPRCSGCATTSARSAATRAT
jgi:hypothetical protein